MIKIKRSGIKENRVTVREDRFSGIGEGTILEQIKNSNVTGRNLRVCRAIKSTDFSLPLTIFGSFTANDKTIVVGNENGHMAFYAVTGNIARACFVSQEVFPYNLDFRDFCTVPVFTDDTSPHILETYNPYDKLLMFPGRKVICMAKDGSPYMMLSMPDEVPDIKYAVFHGGRLYGANENDCYVSGKSGCFHWETDAADAEADPRNSWKGVLTASAEEEQPVTAMTVYKGNVYILKSGAIQKIIGTENPFSVEHVYNVGTFDHRSVCEVGGKLYFLSTDGPVSFDGKEIRYLPMLPEGTILTGVAGKLEGRYAFCGSCAERKIIFIYDPKTESYGIKDSDEEVIAFTETQGKQYFLVQDDSGISKRLRVLGERSGEKAEYRFPICEEHLRSCGATFAAVRGYCKGTASIEASLLTATVEGTEKEYPLGGVNACGNHVTLRGKRKLPKSSALFLKIKTTGDVTLRGYECSVRLKN